MVTYFAVFSLAVLISLLSTRHVLDWAKHRGLFDQPDSSRKFHAVPIPRIGGVAIYFSMLASLGVLCFYPTIIAENFRLQWLSMVKLLGLSGMMLLIGLWDDLRSMKPWTKFSAQILVAIAAWLMGFRILSSWSSEGHVWSLGLLSLPLTILWIVGITNAFNLLDGMDGLAAGAALFASAAMLVASFGEGQTLSPILLLALSGAVIGFLRFNFNPASIFLGDSGSFLLGSMLSLMAVEYSHKSTAAFAIGIPIVALGLPLLDTTMVVLRRFLNGKPIFLGDRRHIHHILIERGLKPRNAVILLYGVCGLFGLFSLLFLNPSGRSTGIVLVMLGTCICVGIQQLHCSEFRELMGYLARGMRYQRRFLIGNVMAGRMIDGFHSARSLPEMLESLSSFLNEMEFSRAEVRVPSLNENHAALNMKNWVATADGPFHYLYRWSSLKKHDGGNEMEGTPAIDSADSKGWSTHFRLEFVFKVANFEHLNGLFEEVKGIDIGRLTFYHPTTTQLPVSAVCLLSRQVWKEFGQAVNRIMVQSMAGLSDRGVSQTAEPSGINHRLSSIAKLPFAWAAPIVNRMTGAHNRR